MTYFINTSILNQKYQVTTHSSSQETSSTANTYVVISGSEMSFAPHSNSTYVIYEIGFYAQVINNKSQQHIKLEYSADGGSSWSEFNVDLSKNFGPNITSDYYRNRMYLKYVVPTWSGSRQLRISSAAATANSETQFHQITEWDGSGSVTDRFCNTSLLVYSV